MSTATLTMPPSSDGKKRNDKAVKIARDLASKAKFIADAKGISIAEYLSNMLRQPVERDFARAIKEAQPEPDAE